MMTSPAPRAPARGGAVGVAAATLVLLLSGVAEAQTLPIREVHVANETDAWSVGQRAFDPTRDVSIFIVFSTDRHGGFSFSGQCVVALAATRQLLHTVRVDPEWMRPGNDVIRTRSFRIGWPAAAVDVTCVPDGNPAGAFTARIGAGHQLRPATPGGIYVPPTPVTLGVIVPGPGISAVTTPVPDCRVTLIEMGHSPAHAVHCAGAEPRCAEALLRGGHSPAHLVHCRGVQPACAETLLRSGQAPAHLFHCR